MTAEHKTGQLIGGQLIKDAGEAFEVRDPGNGELLATVPLASPEQVADAVAAARSAFSAWRAKKPAERGQILIDAANILEADLENWARLVTREMGKPLFESISECDRAVRVLRYYGAEAQRPVGTLYESETPVSWVLTRSQPVGVVGLVTPWNFPAAIPAWKMAPALIFGNTVVIKLAEDTPLSGMVLINALTEAGLPDGVVNVVQGDGPRVGSLLVADEGVDAVSFTGSTATGRRIQEVVEPRSARLQMEMGGHSPAIVCEDADLDLTTEQLFLGAYGSSGQKCTGTRRAFIHSSRYEEVLDSLRERIAAAGIGYGLDPGVEIGPIVNRKQFDSVQSALGELRSIAEVEGGEALDAADYGSDLYMRPAIVTGLDPSTEIARREIFGPVLSVWSFETIEEAFRAANDTEYGLSASIFTANLDLALEFAENINAGVIRVNQQTAGMEYHVPFGGWGASGHGPKEQGRAAMEFFTRSKTIYLHKGGGKS